MSNVQHVDETSDQAARSKSLEDKIVADDSLDEGDVFPLQTLATNIRGDLQYGEAPEEAHSESGVSIFRDKKRASHSKGIIRQT